VDEYEEVKIADFCQECQCYVFDAWGDHTDGNPNHR
jgi:hypothetical protein